MQDYLLTYWVGVSILSQFSVFWSVFFKVGSVFGVGFFKYRGIGIGIRYFSSQFIFPVVRFRDRVFEIA